MQQIDFSYMKPPKDALTVKHDDYYIMHGKDAKIQRKIYEKVDYCEFEEKKIAEFKIEVQKQKDITLPQDWKHSDYLRMLQCGKYNMKLSIKCLQQHLQWRNDMNNQQLTQENIQILEKGILYTIGRDKQFRPVVILNAYLIDVKKYSQEVITQGVSFLLGQVCKYMMIEYHIENWVMIIDTNKVGVSSLPLSALGKIISNMQINFCGRLDKMYILNPSSGLSFVWRAISGFIDEETAQKIGFLTTKEIGKILEKVDADQLEMKFGGKQPNVEQFWYFIFCINNLHLRPPLNIDKAPPSQSNNIIQMEVEAPQEQVQSQKFQEEPQMFQQEPQVQEQIQQQSQRSIHQSQRSIKQSQRSMNQSERSIKSVKLNNVEGEKQQYQPISDEQFQEQHIPTPEQNKNASIESNKILLKMQSELGNKDEHISQTPSIKQPEDGQHQYNFNPVEVFYSPDLKSATKADADNREKKSSQVSFQKSEVNIANSNFQSVEQVELDNGGPVSQTVIKINEDNYLNIGNNEEQFKQHAIEVRGGYQTPDNKMDVQHKGCCSDNSCVIF